jgi:peroxiredoxin Q/BCP
MARQVDAGDKAPDFALERDGSDKVGLRDFKGATLVLYFYPKDDTSGCTKEAIAFSQAARSFDKAGASVLGVSKDSVAAHDKFIAKHKLKVMLGSDPLGAACEAYGVWAEKSMYGKKYFGIVRSTFLIDGRGRIARVWRKVKVPGHVEEVLEAVRALPAS